MTVGNENALPDPEELAKAAGAADPAQADDPPPAEAESTDPDVIEWEAAKAAVKAEETAKGADDQDNQAGADGPQQPPAAAAKDQPQGEKSPVTGQQPADVALIPKPRFDEVLDAKNKAEQNAAYWRGIAEARAPAAPGQSGQPQQAQQQQPQPTPQERIASLRTKIVAVAKQYDDGEITYAELKAQEARITDEIDAAREEALLAKVKPATPAASSGNDELYLETLTNQLEDDHPWVKPFNAVATETEWNFVAARARDNLEARGVPLKGALGSYELRKEISVLIDKHAPSLIADRAEAAKVKGFAFPGSQPSQGQQQQKPAQQQKPLSPEAQARKAALEKAANAPPDISALNSNAGDPNGMPSEAAIEGMSDEEISALPKPVQDRLRGIAAA